MSLWQNNHPNTSVPGIALALAALVLMPVLGWRKRRIAALAGSAALRADAACSLVCAHMAETLLIGLALTALLDWWWADAVAALALLIWTIPEAREALEGVPTVVAVAAAIPAVRPE